MNRRTLLTSLLGLTGAVTVGCAEQAEQAESTAAGSTPAADLFPTRIPNVFGETVVTASPTTVYSLGYTDHDAIMALGVLPVAVTQWFPDFAIGPWARDARAALSGPEPKVLKDADGTNLEVVAAAAPDLISSYYSGLEAEEYGKLTALAPVLTRPPGAEPWSSRWDAQLTAVGTALGRPEEAARLKAELEQRIRDTAAAHPEFAGQSCTLTLPGEAGAMYAYTRLDPRYSVVESLGFTPSSTVSALPGADAEFYVTLSAEEVSKLDADIIGVLASADDRARLEADKLWNKIPAVADGRVAYLDLQEVGYALSFSTVLSVPHALDQVAGAFAAALR